MAYDVSEEEVEEDNVDALARRLEQAAQVRGRGFNSGRGQAAGATCRAVWDGALCVHAGVGFVYVHTTYVHVHVNGRGVGRLGGLPNGTVKDCSHRHTGDDRHGQVA